MHACLTHTPFGNSYYLFYLQTVTHPKVAPKPTRAMLTMHAEDDPLGICAANNIISGREASTDYGLVTNSPLCKKVAIPTHKLGCIIY